MPASTAHRGLTHRWLCRALSPLVDRALFRFDEIWAAAGHPNGVFQLSPDQLLVLTGASATDVAEA